MQNVKKRMTKLKASSIKQKVQFSKDDFKKAPKVSEGGYMWVG